MNAQNACISARRHHFVYKLTEQAAVVLCFLAYATVTVLNDYLLRRRLPVQMQSIAMSVFVCLSVSSHVHTSTCKFLTCLAVAVATTKYEYVMYFLFVDDVICWQ